MPNDPISLQVADRFETVLSSIKAGTNYFYTPHKVAKIPLDYEQSKYGNLYEIYIGEETGPVTIVGRELYDGIFYITVIGIVHDNKDLVKKIIKSWRDATRAIDVDSKSGVAGSLDNLSVQIRIEETFEASYYAETHDGFAEFRQRFRCQITGDFGEL